MATQNNEQNTLLISYMTLRKAIGFLAITLPGILMIGTLTVGGCSHVEASISHYYYTVMGDVFVGYLIATGIFLISYKGYDLKDNIVSFLAGVFVICIALFPTSNNKDLGCVTRTLSDIPLRIQVHFFAAALFFLTLSYMSIFLFTKSSGNMTAQKKLRNRVYRICGIMIIGSILMIGIEDQIPGLKTAVPSITFWLEWVANLSYGISWLIKGEFILKDK
jgi:hypothetical protein